MIKTAFTVAKKILTKSYSTVIVSPEWLFIDKHIMDPVLYHAHHTLRSDDLTIWRDLGLKASGKVLELGCGTGRVLLRFIKENIPVVGMDNDPEMITFLQQYVPPTLSHLVEIKDMDMRNFDLGESFSLIILPCNTLSTFNHEDRLKIFKSVRKHLTPKSAFVFSIPNTLVLSQLPHTGEEELEDEFVHPATNNPVNVYSSWERLEDRLSFYWRYDHVYPDGKVVQAKHSTSHYLDPPQAYISELKATGMKPYTAYGDFYYEKFEKDAAYFVVIAGIDE